MKTLIARFIREEQGQDLIEYALLAAIVALGAVAAMQTLRGDIDTAFQGVGDQLTNSIP